MQKKNAPKKPAVKTKDLQASKNPKGGGKHLAGVKYEDLKRS